MVKWRGKRIKRTAAGALISHVIDGPDLKEFKIITTGNKRNKAGRQTFGIHGR